MKTFIVNRNTPDLAKNQERQINSINERNPSLKNEVIIYNCEEEPFKGKLYGHYQALLRNGDEDCDYYWFNHPDLSFAIDMDCLAKLLTIMEKNPDVAVISPTEDNGSYIGMYKEGCSWHPVATTDYLSLLIRQSVIKKIGFLNPEFKYSWGAIHEYSYKVYKNRWCVAYCDIAKMHHFGGTTYGKNDTISRKEYIENAKNFASKYFIEHYGENWDKKFAKLLPEGVINTYSIHRRLWERRHKRKVSLLRGLFFKYKKIIKMPVHLLKQRIYRRSLERISPLKLNLGSGNDKKEGWVNIDIDWRVKPDLVSDAKNLHIIGDNTSDEIESNHLFEHFTYNEAVEALRNWYRILKPGGKLSIELPDFDRCIEILSERNDPFDWYDHAQNPPEKYALGGIYGWVPAINPKISEEVNIFQLHKYGWTFKTLCFELEKAGFREIKKVPIAQNYRPATMYNRDMRVECIK